MADANEFYLGTDLSRLEFEQAEFDTTYLNSVLIGYQFDKWSLEGGYDISKRSNDFFCGDQEVNMYHLYGVYRSEGTLFYKIKFGLTNERYKLYDSDQNLKFDDAHTGIARGLGVGYKFEKINIEIDYSWLGGSLKTIGMGIRYNFK